MKTFMCFACSCEAQTPYSKAILSSPSTWKCETNRFRLPTTSPFGLVTSSARIYFAGSFLFQFIVFICGLDVLDVPAGAAEVWAQLCAPELHSLNSPSIPCRLLPHFIPAHTHFALYVQVCSTRMQRSEAFGRESVLHRQRQRERVNHAKYSAAKCLYYNFRNCYCLLNSVLLWIKFTADMVTGFGYAFKLSEYAVERKCVAITNSRA